MNMPWVRELIKKVDEQRIVDERAASMMRNVANYAIAEMQAQLSRCPCCGQPRIF